MKDVIKQLTANSKAMQLYGFTRAPEYDFEDDGNHFKGYLWKGKVPLTQLCSGGELYLSVRDDYLYGKKLPYEFWHNYEASKLGDEYNGVSKPVDLAELSKTCETIWEALKQAEKDFQEVEVDATPTIEKLKAEIATAEKFLEGEVNWFECNFNSSGIKEAFGYYESLKKSVKEDKAFLAKIENGSVDKNRLYTVSRYKESSIGNSHYYAKQLDELVNQKSYSWYYIEKKDSMK